MESILKKEFGHSAFEKPKNWGAKRGVEEDMKETISRLKLGKEVEKPIEIEIAKKKLLQLNSRVN